MIAMKSVLMRMISRLSRLSLVKKDKARAVEDSLIAGATNGRLKSKVTEEQLIAMLEQISGGAGEEEAANGLKKKGVVIQRRRYGMEDDDDDDADLL
jgi:programmed cell death protein 5